MKVVLRLLTGEPDDQAWVALRWLREVQATGTTPVVSDLVVSEVYFALQHHFAVPKSEALRQLGEFLSSGDVTGTGVAGGVLAVPGLASAKPGFVDRLIHEGYRRGGAGEMVTFEEAARKLPHVRLLRVPGAA